MNLTLAISLFILIILIYWIICELFTVLFRFTGLPDEKARFQVLSLLTGAGYTTHESEMLLSIRARRRLAQITMLFGYVFNITIVSAFINVFLSMKTYQAEHFFVGTLTPLAVAVILILLIRTRSVRKRIDRLLEGVAGAIMHQDSVNTILLMDYIAHDSIAQVTLRKVPEELREKTLKELDLRSKSNILVMLVERMDHTVEAAGADTKFQAGDKLTVFGNYKTIAATFHAKERFN
ncbi:MAG: TrkA C-terminal domain-containing protein [Lachnospiraceae bacterium]|nr:TrkA C-terminal domain-containing protein [Lachnospiraceae bacterium]